jgi:hypothetical protein
MLGLCGAGLYDRVVIVDPLFVVSFVVSSSPLFTVPASLFIVQRGLVYKSYDGKMASCYSVVTVPKQCWNNAAPWAFVSGWRRTLC